jgi:surface antigen
VTTSRRFAAFTLSALLVSGLSVTMGAPPAEATITTLCKGYTACAKAGMSDSGYGAVNRTMYWRMYSGHNCTNYAAYRMIRRGMPNSRPWTGGGNATYWGTKMSQATTSTPAVGSIAWWKAGVKPAGSAGHVAYVERVVSANEIIVSQDSWNGDFSWTRIVRSGGGWPSGFIHFSDAPLLNTKAPSITGTPKVGATLAASPGVWNPSSATFAYQWLQDGVAIPGATAATLTQKTVQQGKKISVRVTASSLGYPSTSATSAATSPVQAGVLMNTIAPEVTGEAQVGQSLSVTPGEWNPAADEVRYQWRASGVPIRGATDDTLVLGPELLGKVVTVAVTAVKAGYPSVTTATGTETPVAPGTLELAGEPTVVGAAQPGETLTVVLPPAPEGSTVAVQWVRAGSVGIAVRGATSTTYRLTAADAGSRFLAQMTATRPGYRALTKRSVLSPVVRAVPALAVTTRAGKGSLAMTTTVRASGGTPVTGVIQIRSRGKLLRSAPVSNGVARATVTGLPRGTYTYRFRLPSTSKVAGAVIERRITIG